MVLATTGLFHLLDQSVQSHLMHLCTNDNKLTFEGLTQNLKSLRVEISSMLLYDFFCPVSKKYSLKDDIFSKSYSPENLWDSPFACPAPRSRNLPRSEEDSALTDLIISSLEEPIIQWLQSHWFSSQIIPPWNRLLQNSWPFCTLVFKVIKINHLPLNWLSVNWLHLGYQSVTFLLDIMQTCQSFLKSGPRPLFLKTDCNAQEKCMVTFSQHWNAD